MTAVAVHRKASRKKRVTPEPWTWRDGYLFTVVGLGLFMAVFAFMFSLSHM
jgi:hypothetical protein